MTAAGTKNRILSPPEGACRIIPANPKVSLCAPAWETPESADMTRRAVMVKGVSP